MVLWLFGQFAGVYIPEQEAIEEAVHDSDGIPAACVYRSPRHV